MGTNKFDVTTQQDILKGKAVVITPENEKPEPIAVSTDTVAIATTEPAPVITDGDEGEPVLPEENQIGKIARLVALIVAIINEVGVSLGLYSIPGLNEDSAQLVSVGLIVVTSLVGYWKNNSFSKEARTGDVVMSHVRDGKASTSDILIALAKIAARNGK